MNAYFLCYILMFSIFHSARSVSDCDKIKQKYSPDDKYVSVRGEKKNICLYWGSDPARAASALFKTILHYALGYQMVELHEGPHNLQRLTTSINHTIEREYKEVIMVLSTGWEPIIREEFGSYGNLSGLAGPRLQELGASQIPARQQLFMFLAADFRRVRRCADIANWNTYTNKTVLAECGFFKQNASNNSMDKATIYWLDSNNATIKNKLEERVYNNSQQLFKFSYTNRSNLFQLLEKSNASFLFLDYDIWAQNTSVRNVQQPPCITYPCEQELDTSISMRVADVYELEVYAHRLLRFLQIYQPPNEALRALLYLEDINNHDIENAACKWVTTDNYINTDYWVQKYTNFTLEYEIIFFSCIDDEPYVDEYPKLLPYIAGRVQSEISNSTINIREYPENCSDVNYAKKKIEHYMTLTLQQSLLGAVVDGKDILDIAKNIDSFSLPIFLYNAPAVKAIATESIWLSTGQYLHLALALRHFIFEMKWKRFAIISDPSEIANTFIKEIQYLQTENENTNFTFRSHNVKYRLTISEAKSVLKILKDIENARIILVNTNYEDAVTILKAAEELKMSKAKDYVWLVREWHPNNTIVNIWPLTITLWCRGKKHQAKDKTSGNKEISNTQHILNNLNFKDNIWPASTVAIIDAVMTIVHGFREVFKKHPEAKNDVHSDLSITTFKEIIDGAPINGVNNDLVYKDRSLEKTMVFLEEWHGNQYTLIQSWLVNRTDKLVTPVDKYLKHYQVHDGSTSCLLTSGDKYLPDCHYVELAIALLFIILSPPALIMIYRAVQQHEKKRAHMVMLDLIMQRQQNAAIISDHLVDRSALFIRHELGTGRFGSVKLAELRLPGRMPRSVAAKSLREDQDERELVREASILASLVHNHIIRLIGVCIDDKPTLLLMEYALFGDLLHYLQERWYLAEGVTSEPGEDLNKSSEEAVYVSARALTRMAREAASALAYISLCGVVHRDIRASNFLVDANRSLKLADFGLARKITTKSTEGGAEYISIKRMFLPVRAMAPECLNQGTFSTASDVWALGVLVFELVTLGACPYGNMSLQNVASFIKVGGHPPLPHDATPHTIALTRLCWQIQPEQRPTAAEVVAYLAERPCALRPALQFDYDIPESPQSADSVTYPLLSRNTLN